MQRVSFALLAALAAAACQRTPAKKEEPPPAPTAPTAAQPPAPRQQAKPPLPVASPPGDAERLTGIANAPGAVVYVKRLQPGSGARPGRNDTVSVNMNGWRLNGDTFLTTKSRNRPVQQSLALLAPGFAAAVQTMQPGERAMIWVPPELGYMGEPQSQPETTVYEVELVSFESAPPTPPDTAAPPANAIRQPSGLASIVVKPGTGRERPRFFDGVSFHYTAWDSTGRMFDSSEMRKRPKTTWGFHEWPGIEEALTLMVVGERRRVWLPPELADTSLPGLPRGLLTYELELLEVKPMTAPPPAPPDVAGPPPDAKKTAGGVFYKVLVPGRGTARPGPDDQVKVNYAGWRTNGRLFDSSLVRGMPAEFPVSRLIPGWKDALQTMVEGEKARFWIPQELAYNGEPGRPQGMLVLELELLDILPPAADAKKPSVPLVNGPPGDAVKPPGDAVKRP